ncbi:MAG: hypothetical protein IJ719_00125 [Clostridia bacterium]|nr:hypothetical protein [Clostridia bacterium]
MKMFRDPDWYDQQFPAFSERKRLILETPKGVMEVSKELQLIIEEANDKREALVREGIAKEMLEAGKPIPEVVQFSKLSEQKILNLQQTIQQSRASMM